MPKRPSIGSALLIIGIILTFAAGGCPDSQTTTVGQPQGVLNLPPSSRQPINTLVVPTASNLTAPITPGSRWYVISAVDTAQSAIATFEIADGSRRVEGVCIDGNVFDVPYPNSLQGGEKIWYTAINNNRLEPDDANYQTFQVTEELTSLSNIQPIPGTQTIPTPFPTQDMDSTSQVPSLSGTQVSGVMSENNSEPYRPGRLSPRHLLYLFIVAVAAALVIIFTRWVRTS